MADEFSLDKTSGGVAQAVIYSDVLADPTGRLDAADIARRQPDFRPFKDLVPDLHSSVLHRRTLWFRLKPRSSKADSWYLTTSPEVDYAQLIYIADDGHVSTADFGMMVPFSRRGVKLASNVAMLPPGATHGGTLYLRTVTRQDLFGGFAIQPADWLAISGLSSAQSRMLPEMILMGVVGGLGVFNGFLGLALRERIYFRYAAAMVMFCLYLSIDCRMAWEWIWPNFSVPYDIAVYVAFISYLFLTICFARCFVDPHRLRTRWWRALWASWGLVALFDLTFAFYPNLIDRIRFSPLVDATLTMLLLGSILASGVRPYRSGQRGAGTYMIAFLGVVVGIIIEDLGNSELIPTNAWTDAASGIGVAWEALFLALAVGERVVAMRRERDALALLALNDSLTGISNRRSFDDRFAEEWNRATRIQSPLAVVMFDIDHFKALNDHYGHLEGDRILATVAGGIRRWLQRATDFVGRYGGEEFVLILPNTTLQEAARIAEEIRSRIEDLALPHPSGRSITVSAGVASTVPGQSEIAADFLQTADTALYEAKRDGRNCVRVATTRLAACLVSLPPANIGYVGAGSLMPVNIAAE